MIWIIYRFGFTAGDYPIDHQFIDDFRGLDFDAVNQLAINPGCFGYRTTVSGSGRFSALTAQKLFAKQQAALGTINAQVEEVYAGHTIVRAFNHEADEAQKFAQANQKYYQAAWRAQFFRC